MLKNLIFRLSEIECISGIVLGGSRGIGVASKHSDYDIALYLDSNKRISNELLLKHIPVEAKLTVHPALISGYIGVHKFELFQKSLPKVEQEIENNRQGKFQWFVSPLLPFGDLSYRQVSHLVNSEILWERNNQLQHTIEKVTPLPRLFIKSVINHFTKSINNNLIHLDKINKHDDQYHFISLVGSTLFCYINILYVINNRYPIIEKGNWMAATKLEYSPPKLMERMTLVYQSAAVHDYSLASKQLRTLVQDLLKLINERQKK